MKIRMLVSSDIEQLLPLFDAYRQFYRKEPDLENARSFLRDRLAKSEAIIFGAFHDDNLVGFTLLYPLFSSVRMKPIFLLNDLYVDNSIRNQSIGKQLLFYAQSFTKENDRAGILLETEKTNEIGNYLYPSVGFHLESGSNFYFWENNNILKE